MKESYREGVANRPGPEPCEGGREVALEALDRGICRLGIELRNRVFQDADGVGPLEGNMAGRGTRQWAAGRAGRETRQGAADPAESKTPSMQRNFMRENRETPLPPASSGRAGGRR